MALYQPQQGLTWKYVNASGQLVIVAKITVELGPNEKLSSSVSSIYKNSCVITLFVVPGTGSLDLQNINYINIGANLQTASIVQDSLDGLDMVTVRTRVYKNNICQGEVIGVTTQTSEISIS